MPFWKLWQAVLSAEGKFEHDENQPPLADQAELFKMRDCAIRAHGPVSSVGPGAPTFRPGNCLPLPLSPAQKVTTDPLQEHSGYFRSSRDFLQMHATEAGCGFLMFMLLVHYLIFKSPQYNSQSHSQGRMHRHEASEAGIPHPGSTPSTKQSRPHTIW